MLHFACSTEYFPLTLTLSLPPSRRAKAPLRRDDGGERKQVGAQRVSSIVNRKFTSPYSPTAPNLECELRGDPPIQSVPPRWECR